MTTIILAAMKPILLVGGVESQLILVIYLRNLLALKFIATYQDKQSRFLYCIIFYASMSLFFLRTGHRYQLDKLQFAETYLGFSVFKPALHTFLLVLNTYSTHIMALFMLPLCSNTTKVTDGSSVPMTRSSIVLN